MGTADRRLVDDERLATSSVVANCAMNRERGLTGVNSYARELGFDPVEVLLAAPAGVLWALCRAASWLTPTGRLVADFDAAAVRRPDGEPAGRQLTSALRAAGFDYDARRRRIGRTGPAEVSLPYAYLGADDRAGPNYTGQPAVHSHYRELGGPGSARVR